MGDLISRTAAVSIPVLPKEYREYQTMNLDDAYEQGWFDCQKCIEELPSAEPKTPSNGSITCVKSEKMHDRTMGDLISRQDVLHELDGCDYELKDWQRWKLKTMVRDIPSAEPTIIRCRDCKHHDGIRCFRWNSTIITGFDDFCSNAEKRGEEE